MNIQNIKLVYEYSIYQILISENKNLLIKWFILANHLEFSYLFVTDLLLRGSVGGTGSTAPCECRHARLVVM